MKPAELIGLLNYDDLDSIAREVEDIMTEAVNEVK